MSVNKRDVSNNLLASANSRRRPTKLVSSKGRLPTTRWSAFERTADAIDRLAFCHTTTQQRYPTIGLPSSTHASM
ncbi:hypothetical protein ACETU7_15140 [Rhodococcus sp. 3Y1]